MDTQKRFDYLRKRVRRRKKFYRHFGIYIIVVGFLFLLDKNPGFADPDVYKVVGLFWGLGLAIHFFRVFGLPGIGTLDEKWEEDEIQKEHQRLYGHFPDEEPGDKMELKEIQRIHRNTLDQNDFV